jgi:hypothetical protein
MVRDSSARRPAARHQVETALCYWQDQLERMLRHLHTAPRAEATAESLSVELSSTAAATAVRWVAARTRASRSSIVLAAICAVLAQRTGHQKLVLPMLSGNRFERHLSRYVGTLSQGCIATVECQHGKLCRAGPVAGRSVVDAVRASRCTGCGVLHVRATGERVWGPQRHRVLPWRPALGSAPPWRNPSAGQFASTLPSSGRDGRDRRRSARAKLR